ncbi:MAG: hypothetical protein HYX80_03090 [Chloroflexi bacterium]|nr:hypothetical protein [Chloroflexota bacterium]
MKKLWLIASLSTAIVLFTGSCANQITRSPEEGPRWFPEDPNFRQLTAAEKQKVLQIALESPRISEWLQGRNDFRASGIEWYAIIWSDSQPGTWWALDYEAVEKGVPFYVSKLVRFYPGMTIAVGEGTIIQVQVAVDLKTEKAVMVDGPYPSLSSPDRFKSIPPAK